MLFHDDPFKVLGVVHEVPLVHLTRKVHLRAPGGRDFLPHWGHRHHMAGQIGGLGLPRLDQRKLPDPLRFLRDVSLRAQALAPPPRGKIIPVPERHQQHNPIPRRRRAGHHAVQPVPGEEQAPAIARVPKPPLVGETIVDVLVQHQGRPSAGRGQVHHCADGWIQYATLSLQRPLLHVKVQLMTHVRGPVSGVHPPLCGHNLSVDRKIGNQVVLHQLLNSVGGRFLHVVEEGEILPGVIVGLPPVRGSRAERVQDGLAQRLRDDPCQDAREIQVRRLPDGLPWRALHSRPDRGGDAVLHSEPLQNGECILVPLHPREQMGQTVGRNGHTSFPVFRNKILHPRSTRSSHTRQLRRPQVQLHRPTVVAPAAPQVTQAY
mmetsp:Transcript_8038/g.19005  ORF Transcript_8038/g.19005 Transcript_8038/m.19005 type:complete len:376 (-) Transcript_8038:290-1417(-)